MKSAKKRSVWYYFTVATHGRYDLDSVYIYHPTNNDISFLIHIFHRAHRFPLYFVEFCCCCFFFEKKKLRNKMCFFTVMENFLILLGKIHDRIGWFNRNLVLSCFWCLLRSMFSSIWREEKNHLKFHIFSHAWMYIVYIDGCWLSPPPPPSHHSHRRN